MPKVGAEKVIDELFDSGNKKKTLQCPKCKSTEAFSTSTIAIAVALVDKSRRILEIKDLVANFDESLWQCEECDCVFDEYGDIMI